MSEEEVGRDPVRSRMRQCGNCGSGVMFCVALTELRVNSGYAGRDYVFRCESCGHEVNDLNPRA